VRHLDGLAFFGRGRDPIRVVRPEENLGTGEEFLARIARALTEGGR
jgi:hypothetical protein